MKLIHCKKCWDLIALTNWEKYCKCGLCHGRYIDNDVAVVSNHATVMGIPTQSMFVHDGADVLYEDGSPYISIGAKPNIQWIAKVKRNGEGNLVFVKSFKNLGQFNKFMERGHK